MKPKKNKMIPLSVIDALIQRYQTIHDLCNDFWGRDMYMTIIEEFEKIKKEAISIPIPEQPLEPPKWQQITDDIAKRLEKCLATEQRIRDRINELETSYLVQEPIIPYMVKQNPIMKGADNQARIDELRKLLS